ncbi:hypothetical protein LINPERHAP1_LOCUS20714 [Linum perenne]
MKLAWALGVRKIDIQTDFRAAVSILKKEDRPEHQHAALVFEFQELMRIEWEISISHIYREANCDADFLSNLGHSFGFLVFSFFLPQILTTKKVIFSYCKITTA